jgi:ribosomal protein S18 acetylase RimI-like enzyme
MTDSGDLRVTLVRPSASLYQRNRVYALARCANREMHYDFVPYDPWDPGNRELAVHAFVGRIGVRGIALLLAARRCHVWVAAWSETQPPAIIDPRPIDARAGRWTIEFVWVLPALRGRGIARTLIREASRFTGVPVVDLAWYTPFSDAGRDVVHSLCPERFYIGK